MPEELDDDLRDLLDQLDEQDEFLPTDEDIAEELEPAKEEPKPEPAKEEPKPEPAQEEVLAPTGDETALRPIDELAEIKDQRRFDGTEHLSTAAVQVDAESDVSHYLEKMDEVADEILQACRSDRQEAQDVINMLRGQCDTAHNKGGQPSRMYVDGLVKAVEVKANINGNAVKAMEGVSKMIAATKAATNVQNNNIQMSGAELDEILSKNEPSDDLD